MEKTLICEGGVMDKRLRGIGLILFAILFYQISDVFQGYLWELHIGIAVPWAVIALLIGVVGLILVFHDKKE